MCLVVDDGTYGVVCGRVWSPTPRRKLTFVHDAAKVSKEPLLTGAATAAFCTRRNFETTGTALSCRSSVDLMLRRSFARPAIRASCSIFLGQMTATPDKAILQLCAFQRPLLRRGKESQDCLMKGVTLSASARKRPLSSKASSGLKCIKGNSSKRQTTSECADRCAASRSFISFFLSSFQYP